MKSGIYGIRINGKVYVGRSVDVSRRMTTHRGLLASGKHYNVLLQKEYNKHKETECFIIEECDRDNILEREMYWIEKYKSYWKDGGYNLTRGGEDTTYGEDHPNFGKPVNKGITRSEETRKRISDSRKKLNLSNPALAEYNKQNPKVGPQNGYWKGITDEVLLKHYEECGNYHEVSRRVGMAVSGVHQRIKKATEKSA